MTIRREVPCPVRIPFASCSRPFRIRFRGMEEVFGLTVDTENESWQLKVTSDADPTGVVSQYEEKKVTVEIPQYLGEEVQDVTILLLSKDEWVEVCHAKQQPGSVRIGEAVWAKGNLTLKSRRRLWSERC